MSTRLPLSCAILASACIASIGQATTLNLNTTSSGTLNGATFERAAPGMFGSGAVMTILRYEEIGAGDGIEAGYNSDFRAMGSPKTEFDEKTDPNFNRSFLMPTSPLPKAIIELILDTNEPDDRNHPEKINISLDNMELFLSTTGSVTGYVAGTGLGASNFGGAAYKVWDLDIGSDGDSEILMSDFNSGSGEADLRALVTIKVNPTHPYLVLYAKQGVHQQVDFDGSVDAGFEEWAVGEITFIPLPPAAWSGLVTLGAIGAIQLRRRLAAVMRR